jgi:hypothetical protein
MEVTGYRLSPAGYRRQLAGTIGPEARRRL